MKHLAVCAVAFLLFAPGASAHFLPHHRGLTRAERVQYFERSVVHDRGALAFYSRALTEIRDPTDRKTILGITRWHRAALAWHRDLLQRARAALEREQARRAAAALPPHYRAWLCIHEYEGSWSDAGAPYWGGLQMDLSFQAAYGADLLRAKGTADHWTPLEQMWVAERAYRSGRGFYPWPNTARYCGLI